MRHLEWRDLIVSAATDPAKLDALALHMARCEVAGQILCAKGYGLTGATIDQAVRLAEQAQRIPPPLD